MKSDFRLIAEYVAHRGEKEELQKVMRDRGQEIRHPEEFLDALSEVAGDKRFKEIKEQMSEEKKEEGIYMCTILDEYGEEKRLEGRLEGKTERLVDQICKKLRKGKLQETIAEELEENLEQVRQICSVAAAFAPEFECAKVFEAWKNR